MVIHLRGNLAFLWKEEMYYLMYLYGHVRISQGTCEMTHIT